MDDLENETDKLTESTTKSSPELTCCQKTTRFAIKGTLIQFVLSGIQLFVEAFTRKLYFSNSIISKGCLVAGLLFLIFFSLPVALLMSFENLTENHLSENTRWSMKSSQVVICTTDSVVKIV